MAIGSRHEEQEASYSLRGIEHVDEFLAHLWPSTNCLDIDGLAAKLEGAALGKSLHLYSARSDRDTRERLKIKRIGKALFGALEVKEWRQGRKYEEELRRASGVDDVYELYTELGAGVGALVKEKLKLRYVVYSPGGKKSVDIAVDKFVCFSFSNHLLNIVPHYHVEFEGDGTGGEKILCTSRFFERQLAAFIAPLTAASAKWQLAKLANKDPSCFLKNRDSFELALNKAFELIE